MKADERSLYFLVTALWLGNLLPALDATLIGTALPTVIGSLDGAQLYSWVFAAYLLALTVSIPVFGKLTDLFGRKPIYFAGMGLFIVGSLLSTLVQNVEQLIFCRVLIGLATASVQPAAMTIMGDAIPMARRAKLQWVFASAWFVSSVVGPIVASTLISWTGWRSVFLAPIPLAVVRCRGDGGGGSWGRRGRRRLGGESGYRDVGGVDVSGNRCVTRGGGQRLHLQARERHHAARAATGPDVVGDRIG